MDESTLDKIDQAVKSVSHEAHDSIDQRRKYNNRPYKEHPDEVHDIVKEYGGGIIQRGGARLHDVFEDVTPNNPKFTTSGVLQLLVERGVPDELAFKMVFMAWELTDQFFPENHPGMNRVTRKRFEKYRIINLRPPTKTVKLADLKANTQSIVECDPKFAQTYLKEKHALLSALADADSRRLWVDVHNLTKDNFAKLKLGWAPVKRKPMNVDIIEGRAVLL